MSIRFGTDGWRAVISEEFTFSNVRLVSQAIADMFRATQNGSQLLFVVGYDTRFLSDRYAKTVAGVLAANGIRVLLTERFAATPAVSYAIVKHGAAGGVMITASHNPPRYNGLKLKASYGGSASPEASRHVEEVLQENARRGRQPQQLSLDEGVRQGMITLFDPYDDYARHIRSLVDMDAIGRSGLPIAIDAMYGAGIGFTDRILREAGIEPVTLHHEMNPGFGGLHPEPIGKHLQLLSETMAGSDLMLGLATDGDADRIGAVGPDGVFIDPHCIMALTLDYLIQKGQRGMVVKTVSTTQMLNLLGEEHGLDIVETPVGFNHISDLMLANDVLIGGEESGGISIKGHIPEGDGVLMGLLLAELVAKQGGDVTALLKQLMDRIGHFSYARHDYKTRPFSKSELVKQLTVAAPDALAGIPVAELNTRDGVKYLLQNGDWLLIRPSGTEPVLRVYAEAHTPEVVEQLLSDGGRLAEIAQKTMAAS
ncbi:MAG: phosphoglucomutase/phosphomannomutase family protein [Clostridia bacterium]|nr:MAG: phosphoglucomutase/phosphomannomutase family protein [Clostridia bacterium]